MRVSCSPLLTLFPVRLPRFANPTRSSGKPTSDDPVGRGSDRGVDDRPGRVRRDLRPPRGQPPSVPRPTGRACRRRQPAGRGIPHRVRSFDPAHRSARPWLYGIATNLIARHRGSEARRLRAMASLASRRIDGDRDVVGDRAAETVDAEESWSMLVDAIDELPEAERHTLLLDAWEQPSYPDIAAALDVPVGTVRSRLNRARRRLRAARSACEHVPRPIPARPDERRTEGTPR
jgi:RNA polymerase sigma factor (sigma-70 family)